MFKYTQTYETFDGAKITEDFYFNLTEAELTEMEVSVDSGYGEYLMKIVNTSDRKELVGIMQDLIKRSYGVKADDGRRFYKSPDILNDYLATNAYSDFFIKLATDAKLAAEFVTAILPSKLVEELKKNGSLEEITASNPV